MDETIGIGEATSEAIGKEKFIPRSTVYSVAREESRKQCDRDFVRMKNYLAKKLQQFTSNAKSNKKGNNQKGNNRKHQNKKAKTSHPNTNNSPTNSTTQTKTSEQNSTSEVFVESRTDNNTSEVTRDSAPNSSNSNEESTSSNSANQRNDSRARDVSTTLEPQKQEMGRQNQDRPRHIL